MGGSFRGAPIVKDNFNCQDGNGLKQLLSAVGQPGLGLVDQLLLDLPSAVADPLDSLLER